MDKAALFRVLTLALIAAALTGCGGTDVDDVDEDEKRQLIDIPGVTWDSYEDDVKIPDAVFEYINPLNWGARHVDWHELRKVDVPGHPNAGDPGFPADYRDRHELEDNAPLPVVPQEGSPGSGVSFCVMHSVMMSIVYERFSAEMPMLRKYDAADIDGDQVLVEWLESKIAEGRFRKGQLDNIRSGQGRLDLVEADSTSTLDDFCRELEGTYGTKHPAVQEHWFETTFGVHNSLHGFLGGTEPEGRRLALVDARLNIYNTEFYEIHAWIEWRFRKFLEARFPDCDEGYARAGSAAMAQRSASCGAPYAQEVHHHFEEMQEVYPFPTSNNLYNQVDVTVFPPTTEEEPTVEPTPNQDDPALPSDGGGAHCEDDLRGTCQWEIWDGDVACVATERDVENTSCDMLNGPGARVTCCVRDIN